jgi:undecaprenyl-diphosphatase
MGQAVWSALRGGGGQADTSTPYNLHLLGLLILGSIPAAAAGWAFEDQIEDSVRSPIVVGVMLIVFGVVLYTADRFGSRSRDLASSRWSDAAVVGAAQAISLIPGVSRSGVTITAGLGLGLTREAAARFSFLLSTPIIVGAGILEMGEAIGEGIPREDVLLMAAGAVAAALSGWLAIHYLLRFVRTGTYLPFVFYRFAAGAFVIVYFSAA